MFSLKSDVKWASASAITLALVCTTGCTTVTGEPIAGTPGPTSTAAPSVRQTDGAGRNLPFATEFANRWNINNDGSTYEPCTQVSDDVIRKFGLDPSSVRDVAASDFQTARGCNWKLIQDGRSSIAQFVANILRPNEGLTGHKTLNRAGTTWLPDIELEGRRVLVESMMPGECTVYVQSGTAVVITSVTRLGFHRPATEVVCNEATDFLRATIGEIPV
ncbi:DUF3558 family protein [Gordonia hongkongensis]|uniref:DUF3558 family protein n=1 Tax=Gordonia hongkongensis TaxID=1701090 RepID=UPI003D7440B0